MTQADIVAHWQKGSKESFELAKLARAAGMYALTLFHCHLAVEKILKAKYIANFDEEHPYVHDLLALALLIDGDWSDENKMLFTSLTDYAVAARYDDPEWAEHEATPANADKWIVETEKFLSSFPQ